MTAQDLDLLRRDLGPGSGDAAETLAWAARRFPGRIAFASSFGAEDMVVIDLIAKASLPVSVFTLDTGRLPEETYELIDRVRSRYGIPIGIRTPETGDLEELVTRAGFFSFRESVDARKECCRIRKVAPLTRELSGLEAWITGLRREQSLTRTELAELEWDGAFGLIKINPLADWSDSQVWDYVRANDVPYNRLHDQGYPSIGCAPCTRAVQPGQDLRAGRWWWESPEHKECGLHPGSDSRDRKSC